MDDTTIPSLSIANASEILGGADAEFVVTSDIPFVGDLAVAYNPVKSGGDYLDESDGQTGTNQLSGRDRTITLTFAEDNGNYTATLSFATTDFSTDADSSGTITVTLQEDPAVTDTYTVKAGSGAATVTVYKVPVPTLTIASTSLTQSVNEGQTASIVVEASENPRRELNFSFIPRETGTSYLVAIDENGVTKAAGDTRSVEMEFAQAGQNPQPKRSVASNNHNRNPRIG